MPDVYLSDVVVSLFYKVLIVKNLWSHIMYERDGERNLFFFFL